MEESLTPILAVVDAPTVGHHLIALLAISTAMEEELKIPAVLVARVKIVFVAPTMPIVSVNVHSTGLELPMEHAQSVTVQMPMPTSVQVVELSALLTARLVHAINARMEELSIRPTVSAHVKHHGPTILPPRTAPLVH